MGVKVNERAERKRRGMEKNIKMMKKKIIGIIRILP